MTDHSQPDRDALLMLISAYLDGELSAADELRVQDALGRDGELLAAFEAMSAARLPGAVLAAEDAEALTASVLAATGGAVPATGAGAAQLASLAVDGALDDAGARRLDLLLQERPSLAGGVLSLVASSEAVQVAARAAGELPTSERALQENAARVGEAVAAAERLGALASGALDGALSAAEDAELAGALPLASDAVLGLHAARHAGEALASATAAAPFAAAAKKAGEAALHVIAVEARQAAARAPAAPASTSPATRVPGSTARPGLLARLRQALGGLSAPLAFAATAATLFFVLREPGSASSDLAAREASKKALFDLLAPQVIADSLDLASAAGELPLLADNAADVEAIDATSTTMVFATEQSNITVIWVADIGDSQGT